MNMASSSSGLTQSDLERIEQNKQKALEKLSRKRKPDFFHQQQQPLPKKKDPKNSSIESFFSSSSSHRASHSSNNTNSFFKQQKPNKSSKDTYSSFIKPVKPKSKELCALFSLVTASRFTVDVTYDKSVIDIFKTIQSRQYDSETRTWTFNLDHYFSLVKKLQSSISYIEVKEIPRPILNVFLYKIVRHQCPPDITDRVPRELYSSLMEFQKEGLQYCVARGGRALLADDMGLGKTIQAISVACYYRTEWPLLVVCPASVKMYWAESFTRWVPGLSCDDINVVFTASAKLNNAPVNICSYDCLKIIKSVKESNFTVIICDESHFLKNHKTARCKVVIPLVKKARRAIFLSGTPALSRPIELYTQIVSLDPSFRMKLTDFGERYCNGVKNHFGWDMSGATNMNELQLYLEQSIMIRRMKNDVLDQLPPKQRQMVVLNPALIKIPKKDKEFNEQMRVVKKNKEFDKDKETSLLLYSKTAEMKLDAVGQYVLDMLEGKRKFLVFGHHKIMLDKICELLKEKNYRYVRIDGATPSQQRSNYCDQFQHDDDVVVAVLSITAANTGITLTSSSTVIFAELFWNPGVLVQAEDRVYRIGQKDSVNIQYLVAKGTIDDYLWPLVNKKLDVLNKVGLAAVDFRTTTDTTSLEEPMLPSAPDNDDIADLDLSSDDDEQWFSTLEDDALEILDDL